MSETHKAVVCDAGPLIHLDELGCLQLLSDFTQLLVPDAVWEEVARHRPSALAARGLRLERRDCSGTPGEIAALAALFTLQRGETEALCLASELQSDLLLTDDTAARLAAGALGIAVHGSIGIVVRAIRRRQKSRAEVVELLRNLPHKTTLFIRPSLLQDIIREVETAA